jgi:hypothetical protein
LDENLTTRILELLTSSPQLKTRDIAARLGVDRWVVNSLLYGPLSERVSQDRQYRWSLRSSSSARASATTARPERQGPIAQLCRYYLECISRDSEIEISEFARSEFDVKYCEIPKLPFANADDTLSSPEARGFIRRARQDRLQVYLDYSLDEAGQHFPGVRLRTHADHLILA